MPQMVSKLCDDLRISVCHLAPVIMVEPFTTPRERKLWIYVLVVLTAIYATLGLAASLVDVLRRLGLLEITFFTGFALVGLSVFVAGIRLRPGGLEVGAALGITAVYLLLFVRMEGTIVERTHLMEYSVLAVLIYEALKERALQRRVLLGPAILAMLLAILCGMIDEGLQWLLPNRFFDPIDVLFNTLAAVLAVTAAVILRAVRRFARRVASRTSGS